jgi:nitrite reductase/ring-hydroxylating ferredoxin subunit/thioredoxin reductase
MKLARSLAGRVVTSGARTFTQSHFARRLFTPKMLGYTFTTLGLGILSQMYQRETYNSEELIVKIIGKSEDFPEGQMKEIVTGDNKDDDVVLVVRLDGKLYAIGAKCSHFGAPLVKGLLFGDRVYCPWHLASFDVKTGYPDNGPMMDAVPVYPITEKDGQVAVTVPKKIVGISTKIKTITRDPSNKTKFVIVGGGVSGAAAAESLRQSGFTGEILMISGEEFLPYDRTALTKAMLTVQAPGVAYRKQEYYDQLGVTFKGSTLVTDVNAAKKTLKTKAGEEISYDKLLIATGVSPIRTKVPGHDLQGIYSIRELSDVYKLRETAKTAKNVVVIGGGLIGTETASNLKLDLKDKVNVTVVSRDQVLGNSFGKEVGGALQKLGEESGVHYVTDEVVEYKRTRILIKQTGHQLER